MITRKKAPTLILGGTIMRTLLCILGAGLLVAGLLLAGQPDRQPEVLLQAAMNTELVKGDLEAAIQQYKKILAAHAGNRAIAAKALVRMGHCYERLGNAEAQQAYQRVMREFPDQSEAAAEARTRLTALGQPPTAMATRQLWTGPDVDVLGSVSADGRYLSFVDWSSGDLAVRDLLTGQNRRLTNKGSWDVTGFALFSRISPDGKLIAYDWYNQRGAWELRVGGMDGAGHRTLYSNDEVRYVLTAAWSPDGRHVLAQLMKGDGTDFAPISVADGSTRILKSTDWRNAGGSMAFSPDGKYIAYDFPPSENLPERDVYILTVDGTREIRAVEDPADDRLAGWTPDGKQILFTSDRMGTWDAWTIPVADGKPQGPPEVIKRNIGLIDPLGFTRNRSFYYGVSTGMVDVYTASLDVKAGKVVIPPTRAAQRFIGSNRDSDWSPDGGYLAYVSGRGPFATAPGLKVLGIVSLETGKQREVPLALERAGHPRFSPDGRSVLLNGADRKQREGIYLVDVQTGQATLLVPDGRVAVWSRDGKTIFFTRFPEALPKEGDRIGQIIARDLATGAEKEIYREATNVNTGDGLIYDLAISPDGRSLAFTVVNGKEPKSIKVLPIAGGEARVIYRVAKEDPQGVPNFSGLEWSADGRELLFIRTAATEANIGSPVNRDLWALPVGGGQPRKLGLSMLGLTDPRLHPDGKRISFTAGGNKAEVWVMENFLR